MEKAETDKIHESIMDVLYSVDRIEKIMGKKELSEYEKKDLEVNWDWLFEDGREDVFRVLSLFKKIAR